MCICEAKGNRKMKQCNTYIDEAGQTGFDIWNYQTQPFFVLAGLTVEEGSSDLADYVENMFQTHRQPNQNEFKTNDWLKRPSRRQCVLDMYRYICEHAASVNVVVIEKKFMIAALIVNKFFDGAYNDFGDYTWVNDKEERLKAANCYYELFTDDDLHRIGECLMHPDEVNTKAVWNVLWERTTEPEYKRVLVGVEDHLDEINTEFHAFALDNEGLHETITNSPNFTAFSQLGNMIAMSAKEGEYATRLIFDDCPSCTDEFKYIFDLFQKESIPDDLYTVLGFCSWKNRVTEFSVGDSQQDYNLQTADVVASLIYYVFKNILTNSIPGDFDKNIIAQIKTMIGEGKLWYVTSGEFITKCMNAN